MRDDIKFHAFMKMTREAAGVSLEEAGKGLYTKSMMAQIEKGTTLPDYMMRNRIMSRLGISSEGYEDFLQPEEYKRYLKRMELIELIESKQFDEAETHIDELLSQEDLNLNKLELQFYYDMKARCCLAREASWENIFELYKGACTLTIDIGDVKEKKFGVWATLEYFLLFKMLEAEAKCASTLEDSEKIVDICVNLLEHLEKSTMDTLGKAKVYTAGAVVLGNIIRDKQNVRISDEELLAKYDRALKYLQEKSRSYYILDLLKYKIDILEKNGLKDEYKNEKCLFDLFSDIYKQNDIDGYMEYNCYLYRDSDIYCISDVIKTRRKMLQISREELAEKVHCSYRTIMRIENGTISAQKAVLRPIMDELNINCDYTRSDIITTDRELLDKYYLLVDIINNAVNVDFKKIYEELDTGIDFTYSTNVQLWDIVKYFLLLSADKITTEEYIDKMKEDLELTLHIPVLEIEDGYLLHAELYLLKVIVEYTQNEKEKKHLMELVETFCDEHESGGYPVNYSFYESIMIWMADAYSDEDKIEKVGEVSKKLLHLELKSHRLFELHGALYMLLRNKAKVEEESSEKYKQSIDKIIEICDFINNSVHKEYYILIKKLIDENSDWKHY